MSEPNNRLEGRTFVELPVPTWADTLWRITGIGLRQHSILVYNDGTVVEGEEFDTGQISDPDVHTFIQGGTAFRCPDSGWLHDTLVAAGYECVPIEE